MSVASRRSTGTTAGKPSGGGLRRAFGRVATVAVFGILPIALMAYGFYATLRLSTANSYWDFHPFWNAGRDVLHGRSPYPPPSAAVLAHEKSFVYPAPAALLMAPFALLPFTIAATLFALLLTAAVPAALYVVGVRDWRCYGIALLSEPVLIGVTLDTVSPLLLLALAATWRLRDRLWPAACVLAAAVVLKIFLWPLLLWFALTRRLATAAAATGLIVLTTLAAWAVIAFRGLGDYPHELRILNHLLQGKGYSLVSLGLSLGGGRILAQALPFVVGACILALVALKGRRAAARTGSPSRSRSPRRSRCRRSSGSTTSCSCSCRSRSRRQGSPSSGRSRSHSGSSAGQSTVPAFWHRVPKRPTWR